MPQIAAGELTRQVTDMLARRDPAPAAEAQGPMTAGGAAWLGSPLPEVLARRRSVRRFTKDPLPLEQLTGIISAAEHAERNLWSRPSGGALGVAVAAVRVDGLPSGLHLVGAGRGLGAPTALPAPPGLLPRLREGYADAPAILLTGGDLWHACRADGSGYAELLMRCASLGYAAWLAAIGLGLGGCVFGGANQMVTATVRNADRPWSHLFTTVVGVPSGDGPEAEGPS